ncbi:hypothetical protein [Natronococcus roseus]
MATIVSDLGIVLIVVGLCLMLASGLLAPVIRSGFAHGSGGVDR